MRSTFAIFVLQFTVTVIMFVETAYTFPTENENTMRDTVPEKINMTTSFFDIKMVQVDVSEGSVHSTKVWLNFQELVNMAKMFSSFHNILVRSLMKLNFQHDEIQNLLKDGFTTVRGQNVSFQDVSKFCCSFEV
ncbi:uncharacterized protein LOC143254495 [Tachypleus tridentatus]|uniref:uncharacterized protein LOC143254495 n=1 Tax=Tachypleus tridentatus TaxID=6853 RepID=UPI003FD62BC9